MHNTMDCNAFILDTVLGYYVGGLYTLRRDGITYGVRIERRNLDGTDHRIVATVNYEDYEIPPSNLMLDFAFDCGKAYIFLQEGMGHLSVVDLKDGSQSEVGRSFFQEKRIGDNWPIYHNGKLYALTEENCANADHGLKLVELDLESETWRELVEGDVSYYVTDSTLYFLELDQLRRGGKAAAEPGFQELDLNTGEVKNFGIPVEDESFSGGFYDDEYFYAECGDTGVVYIVSLDGYKLVDRLELPAGSYCAADIENRLYICEPGAENSISHYLDKSQIGSHQLTLTEVEMLVPDKQAFD